MRLNLIGMGIALSLLLPQTSWGQDVPKFRQKLNEFISIALENNPKLLEAQNRIKFHKEIPSQAGSLDDPMLTFGIMNVPVDTLVLNQEAMTQKQITLSQKFPFPGKLGLREDIAAKNITVTEQDYEERKLEIKRQVKQAYFELCFILAAMDITKQNKSLLEQFIKITESKYSVGKGIQQDVLKAQVELSKIMDRLIGLNKRKKVEQAKLNTLMNKLPQEQLVISHGISKTPYSYKLEGLQSLSEEHRPILKELQAIKEKYQLAKRLAEKEYYPDFKVGIRYGLREDNPIMDRPDFVSGFVGINIPIWFKSKQSRKVTEQVYKMDMVQEALNDSKNKIFLKIKEITDEEARTSETLSLIQKGILPQARQSLEAALAGYSVDKVDFLTLLNNQVTLFNWQIKYHRELTTYEKNLADLERMVGKDLFSNNPTNPSGKGQIHDGN